MLKRLFGALGYVPEKDLREAKDNFAIKDRELSDALKSVKALGERMAEAKSATLLAERKLLRKLPIPVVGVTAYDPSPNEPEQRKLYVAKFAGFHTDILKPKLVSMIADIRAQFEQLDRETFGLAPEQYDWILKGTINGISLISDYGDQMVNEQVANQSEQNKLSEEEKAELKGKLKE